MGWNPFKRRKKSVATSSPITMATAPETNGTPVAQVTPPPPGDAAGAAVTSGTAGVAVTSGTAGAAVTSGTAGAAVTSGTAGAAVTSGAAGAAVAAGGTGVAVETDPAAIEQQVIDVLRTIYDPEVPVNIYDLGLIYGIDVLAGGAVKVTMTLTSPACPVAGSLPPEVEQKVQGIPAVPQATVEITWDPPWDPDQMSEAARLQLGL